MTGVGLFGWAGSTAIEGEDKDWRRGKDTGRLRRLLARAPAALELETFGCALLLPARAWSMVEFVSLV
jgi:hypothetical protein